MEIWENTCAESRQFYRVRNTSGSLCGASIISNDRRLAFQVFPGCCIPPAIAAIVTSVAIDQLLFAERKNVENFKNADYSSKGYHIIIEWYLKTTGEPVFLHRENSSGVSNSHGKCPATAAPVGDWFGFMLVYQVSCRNERKATLTFPWFLTAGRQRSVR